MVLLIENHPIVRETLAMLLTRSGFDVLPVSDEREPLRAAMKKHGRSLQMMVIELSSYRRHSSLLSPLKDNPTILISNAETIDDMHTILRNRPNLKLLHKPFSLPTFLSCLRELDASSTLSSRVA